MSNIEEKLKALRQAAKERAAMAPVVEVEVDLPDDVDENRFAEIAKEINLKVEKPTVSQPQVDWSSKLTVIDDVEDERQVEEEPLGIEEEEPEYFPDDYPDDIPEDEEEIPETVTDPVPDEIPDYTSREYTGEGLRGLVVSVTTLPFVAARQSTKGEKPMIVTKYQVLFETLQPLQLGREYTITL